MPAAFDVVGLGENSVDFVYRVPHHPAANGKVQASGYAVSCGGQVATTLATCAAFGLRTAYLGAFGDDEPGRTIRGALARRQIDLSHAAVRAAANRHAVIVVDERNGDRTVIWHRDPGLRLRAADVPGDCIRTSRLLHVDDLDEEASIAAASIAGGAGIPVTGDFDRASERTGPLLDLTTVPIFSTRVPEQLTGEADPERALRKLRMRHRGWLCVTLGADGAMLLEGDRVHHAPAVTVTASDTTGAGDVFRGAFIYAMLRGDRPAEILRFAVTAASVSCTRYGAIDSVPQMDEVVRWMP